jgi:hypothetical protein
VIPVAASSLTRNRAEKLRERSVVEGIGEMALSSFAGQVEDVTIGGASWETGLGGELVGGVFENRQRIRVPKGQLCVLLMGTGKWIETVPREPSNI